MELSKRLSVVAELLREQRVADIGSDHALLPVYLIREKLATAVVAGEYNPGPLAAARRQVKAAGLSGRVDVRGGDGLEVLVPGEVEAICLAGMGGGLIRDILEKGRREGKLEGVRELVLQPNIGAELVRAWLVRHDWYLDAERILEEDGKIYEVLRASRPAESRSLNARLYADGALVLGGGRALPGRQLYRLGPWLLREAGAVWRRHWESEQAKLERVAAGLGKASGPEAKDKAREVQVQIETIKEVLACTSKDKPSFN
ncbi:tRNA (adenine(22)-N(1))-methyltransferase TrmK [Paenibacillus sp. IB182496]|uniref:tRNA (Adenine(22)-N(1))-methyltransferase TrmK n=1 Tax=Paenibacillus sabuli TaxID=2772509 RepID=A0A927BRN3_9BACL|nr:tRNA (adenine(22)-N(1))-methyltransferase TrmK [Paenibacillus sabuli]MBD2844435.1 tRNA (adenine(22)-N(1))-methyltransferase TrmK [Paenibacillus sabuli]